MFRADSPLSDIEDHGIGRLERLGREKIRRIIPLGGEILVSKTQKRKELIDCWHICAALTKAIPVEISHVILTLDGIITYKRGEPVKTGIMVRLATLCLLLRTGYPCTQRTAF